MKLQMYSIRDSKVGTYHPPIFQKTHGEAERNFTTIAKDDKTQVGQYPEDFDLFYIGDYEDNSGKVSPLDTPQHIMKALDAKGPKV